jgi:hypothetical protein
VIVHGADNPEMNPELPDMDPAQVEQYLLGDDAEKFALAMKFCYFRYIIPFYFYLTTHFQPADAADACCEAVVVLLQRINNGTLIAMDGVRGLLRVVARRAARKLRDRQTREKPLYGRRIDKQVSIPVDRASLEELLTAIRDFVSTMPCSEREALLSHIDDVFGDVFDAGDAIAVVELELDFPSSDSDAEEEPATHDAQVKALWRARQRLESFLEMKRLMP